MIIIINPIYKWGKQGPVGSLLTTSWPDPGEVGALFYSSALCLTGSSISQAPDLIYKIAGANQADLIAEIIEVVQAKSYSF